jgi:hypothetical protein
MSNCLCKSSKGYAEPFQVKLVIDRLENAIHTLHIDKAYRRSGPAPDFRKTAFTEIGDAELLPQGIRTMEEGQDQ